MKDSGNPEIPVEVEALNIAESLQIEAAVRQANGLRRAASVIPQYGSKTIPGSVGQEMRRLGIKELRATEPEK